MKDAKVLTKHPLGKSGRSISKEKYEAIKKVMLSALRGRELTHAQLFQVLGAKLKGRFDGNVSWYGETVKLDLEARRRIQRTDSRPQRYRLR